MTDKLNIGIIGLGVGEQHIAGYENTGKCVVTSLCDCDQEKSAVVKTRFSDKNYFSNPADILLNKEIDAVSIATFDNFHCEQIIKAVENGKHVFVEKPLCMSESEANAIKAALDKNKELKFSSNLILRKCPRFIKLKEAVLNRDYGQVYNIEADYNYGRLHKLTEGWRGDLEFYSIVYGGGVHLIDLMMWILEDKIIEAFSYGNNICSQGSKFKYDDMVTSVLKFESGIVGRMACNFGCVRPHFHSFSLYGTEACFINDTPNAWRYTSREKSDKPEPITDDYPGYHKGDLIASFVDAILNDKEPEVSKADVFNAMSACFAIEKSLNSNSAETVNYLY